MLSVVVQGICMVGLFGMMVFLARMACLILTEIRLFYHDRQVKRWREEFERLYEEGRREREEER